MSNPIYSIFIAYGSESGHAESLAYQLYQQDFLQSYDLSIATLNDIDIANIHQNSLLIIITSTFGDGEAPENAEDFLNKLELFDRLPFRYSIFALGDASYDHFCGYGKQLDQIFQEKQAQTLIQRVDADLNFQDIFNQWQPLLQQSLSNLPSEPVQHNLSIQVYNENSTYTAKVLEIKHLAQSEPAVFHLTLDLQNSGIRYQAGDLLYVNVDNPDDLLALYAQWFNDAQATVVLKNKELRVLNKNVLRAIAKLCQHEHLKELLKISNKKALEEYLYVHDLLDVLQDFDTEKHIQLNELVEILANRTARAYSISSCGKTHTEAVDLCIRQVGYHHQQRDYQGITSCYLANLKPDNQVSVFVRSNPNFHLPENINAPIIMIGAGTGIAPFIGFLQFIEQYTPSTNSYLFFGERYRQHDFLYETELNQYLAANVLNGLFTAFSRDQTEKYYVQDALLDQAELVWQLLEQGAYIYVCGSKNMGKAVDESLIYIAEHIGQQTYVDAFNNIIANLVSQGRLLKDLY
ncbi:sulfite reductase flavoprotein subunit alpha [Acinetobacter qingfengensis]|uniref:Sulfite reductase n=1 Tax=Acinetobacter qingfengensis TaxID=1262585 RepID=A0A1E7RCH1_9GAMM|nr:sulfite reductase flavoprotein subunit alpha [Acinetobacter qingfengensis]KAA8734944.1 sulfite reductase flavoprotein subunit alpha [Acinetobacter qingfengensis]OEY97031.1 sulfite reductase [Acinetobacter qingfengensis]